MKDEFSKTFDCPVCGESESIVAMIHIQFPAYYESRTCSRCGTESVRYSNFSNFQIEYQPLGAGIGYHGAGIFSMVVDNE